MKKLFSTLLVLASAATFAAPPPFLRNSATTNANVTLRTNLTSLDSGGAARGVGATDLQTSRAWSGQVASGNYSTLSGGRENLSGGVNSVVGGGSGNTNGGLGSVIGGGALNFLGGSYQTIGGGFGNRIDSAPEAYIGGGKHNVIQNDADDSTMVAGEGNIIGPWAHVFVGGGKSNMVGVLGDADGAVLVGGRENTNDSSGGFLGGGFHNTLSGLYSILPGGLANYVAGNLSFAIGSSNLVTGSGAGVVGNFLTNATDNSVLLGVRSNYVSVGSTFTNTVPFSTASVSTGFGQTITNGNSRCFFNYLFQITGDEDIFPSGEVTIKVTNSGVTNTLIRWRVPKAPAECLNSFLVPVGPRERVWAEAAGSVESIVSCFRVQ